MLTKTALAVAALIAAVLLLAATRPDTFRVERSADIQARPEILYAAIGDLRRWGAWSPYEKLDPGMRRHYSGAASGRGAIYEWRGNAQAGAGRMEITDATPFSRLAMRLDFIEPFAAHNNVEFSLQPHGDATRVTWAMHGPVPYPAKIMHLFFNVDRMVGQDFEAGLSNLKTLAESSGSQR